MNEILARLRARGWSVAVHNDYRLDGHQRTFWLLTHPNGTWVKGEGFTDEQALSIAETQATGAGDCAARLLSEAETAKQVEKRVRNVVAMAQLGGYSFRDTGAFSAEFLRALEDALDGKWKDVTIGT